MSTPHPYHRSPVCPPHTLTVSLAYVHYPFDVAETHHLEVLVRLDCPDGVQVGARRALDAVVFALLLADLQHKREVLEGVCD